MLPAEKALIEQFQVKTLPVERTLYSSTYRSKQEFESRKPYGTAIISLYCNEPYSVTLFHYYPLMKFGIFTQATHLD